MESRFRLRLLGPPGLVGSDGPVEGRLAQRHRLAILAALALSPGQTARRDRLHALLWPESDTQRARHLLNVALHELRQGLDPDAIRSRGQELQLDLGIIGVDVLEFRDACRAGDHARAVALYTGPLLDAFFLPDAAEFDHWLDGERADLDAGFLNALETLARQRLEAGGLTEAAEDWRRLVARDPLNSRFVLGYVQALAAAGDPGNALQAFAEHEALLRRELDAEPDQVLLDLARELRQAPRGLMSPLRVGSPPSAAETGPARRRAWWVAAVASVAGLALLGTLLASRTTLRENTVYIAPFESRSDDPAVAALASFTEERVRALAVGSGFASVVWLAAPVEQAGVARGGVWRRYRDAARSSGAGTLLVGWYEGESDSLHFTAEILDLENARPRAMVARRGVGRDAADDLAQRVVGALAALLDERLASVTSPESPPPRLDAYREFAAGAERVVASEYWLAARHFLSAARLDSTFHAARVWAIEALSAAAQFARSDSMARALATEPGPLPPLDRLGLDWALALHRGDGIAAYRAARDAARLSPRSRWAVTWAAAATELNRPKEALDALKPLEARPNWLHQWVRYHQILGRAHHLLGRHKEELAVARRARALETDLIIHAIAEAAAFAGMGRVVEVERLVDEALALADQPSLTAGSLMQRAAAELEAHGHPEAARRLLERAVPFYRKLSVEYPGLPVNRWALANVLYRLGRLDEADALYRELHQEQPRQYSFHGQLGAVAARHGDRDEALRWDSLLAVPQAGLYVVDAAFRVYARARIHVLLGDRDRAMDLLRESVARGVAGVPLDPVHLDGDLRSLLDHPTFGTLLRQP